MKKLAYMTAHGLGSTRESAQIKLPSNNHAKSAGLTKAAAAIKAGGFRRVAGNIFILDSSKEFWKLDGDKVIRLSAPEVDNSESIAVATSEQPDIFMNRVFGDLTF